MNRRNFLHAIGIGVACLALRIKPDAYQEYKDTTGALTLEMFNEYLEYIFRVRGECRDPGPFIFYSVEQYKTLKD